MKNLLACLCLFVITASSTAAVLLTENFNYTNGPLITVSGGTWAHTSGATTGEVDVASGAVNLTSAEVEDVGASLTATTSNVFYAGFAVKFSALPSSGGEYFAHFDGSAFRARVRSLIGGAASGKFRLGLSSTVAGINVTNTTDLSTNVTYTVIVRLTNTTGVASLWINPSAESDPSITTTETANSSTVNSFALRQTGGIGTLTLDNLTVATTFAEALAGGVTSGPPLILVQPVSQTVTQGSNITFSVAASGGEPLSYQWSFSGTNLPGANSASLILTNVTVAQAGDYFVTITNLSGATNSDLAELTVFVPQPPTPPGPPLTPELSVLNYNTHGNFVADWSTNSLQVRAIGRQCAYLNPDIITFQEIPMTNSGWAKLPDFISVFLPGYYLATNSGTDTFIRSAILSRYPITRSQSWLDGADLNPFGYTNANFTRDLFEAEIAVPNFPLPLHVFTTHLKSGTSASADAQRRAAEASAISNFFVTVFLPGTNGTHPYLLTGDLNEDIARPATGSQQPIQRLANNATGLHLTTPTNPVSGNELTFSIQSVNGLTRRYDYILPGGLLYSNIASSMVFRTDKLTNPPAPLLTNDNYTASDHLPVMMWFANPYGTPFRLLSVESATNTVTLRWESVSNRIYGVEASTNFNAWSTLASNLTATGTNTAFTTNSFPSQRFFRVFRLP